MLGLALVLTQGLAVGLGKTLELLLRESQRQKLALDLLKLVQGWSRGLALALERSLGKRLWLVWWLALGEALVSSPGLGQALEQVPGESLEQVPGLELGKAGAASIRIKIDRPASAVFCWRSLRRWTRREGRGGKGLHGIGAGGGPVAGRGAGSGSD